MRPRAESKGRAQSLVLLDVVVKTSLVPSGENGDVRLFSRTGCQAFGATDPFLCQRVDVMRCRFRRGWDSGFAGRSSATAMATARTPQLATSIPR
jgi:hypothetical protein